MTPGVLHDLLRVGSSQHRDRVAVWCPARGPVSYGELDALTNRIAHFLRSVGVQKGDRVGIWLPKSADAVAATQGTLRAGAAYVPIDPIGPVARAATILSHCEVAALISDAGRLRAMGEQLDSLPPCLRRGGQGPGQPWSVLDDFPATALEMEVRDPSSLAYVLFTSGSSGVPKGVCISHEAALAFVEWAAAELRPTPDDVFSNHAPLHFDLSVLDLYVAFGAGASVAIVPEAAAFVAERLVDIAARRGVTIWYSVPSALVLMMEAGGLLRRDDIALRQILFAGEPFPPAALARLRRHFPRARFLNLYGPTETNVCTFYEVPQAALYEGGPPIPIGVPCCGDEAWAERQEDGARAVAGEVGELVVRGPTVMLGYFGDQPRPKAAPYRTGDWVRVREDGAFDYLGRRDGMVKLRGHRVELGEIEATLGRVPALREVAAAVVGAGVSARLVAALVASGAARPTLLELKALCAERLPRYMIIDRAVWFESLPRTANGKIDRRAIAAACETPGGQDG